MPSVLQIYAPQKLWRTQIVDRIAAVSNYWTVTNYGVVGDGVTDDTAAWQAIFDAVPNGTIIIVPDPTFVMVLTSTITMTDKHGVIITSQLDANNFAPVPTFKWAGGNHGVMLDMERCQACHVEGFNWITTNGTTVDTAVNIDGFGVTGISTKNWVRFNSFNFSNQLNSAAKIVSISATATSNNENMRVWDNEFIVSNTGFPTPSPSAGYGIYNGPSANAKHQLLYRNNISNATTGIYMSNGSCDIQHVGGGANLVDIHIPLSTEPAYIRNLETENSTQGVIFEPGNGSLTLDDCRFSNSGQTNAGGFVELAGTVTIRNSNFEARPPVGGVVIKWTGSNSLLLTVHDSVFAAGTTYAETGLQAFVTSLEANVGLGALVVWNLQRVSGMPSRYFFQSNNFDPVTNDPVGWKFRQPISLPAVTFAQLTLAGNPAGPGALACVTNSNTNVFGAAIAGGGGFTVLAFFNGANWTVAGI